MYRIDQRSNTRINQFFLILCTVVFLLFCPVLTGEPISKTWIEQMLVWMQGWNFY
jgi:dolichyl-phosphate-mannose--protein O-mannosyl transferase